MDNEELNKQLEELRAARMKPLSDEGFEDDEPIAKKSEFGVFSVQLIISLILAIAYILFSTFNGLLCNQFTAELKEKAEHDFSFGDGVYNAVGDIITRLNEIKPVQLGESGIEQENGDDGIESGVDIELNGAGGYSVKSAEIPTNATMASAKIKGSVSFPIKSQYRLTSPFGFREGVTTKGEEFHTGVDIAAAEGSDIHAAADGIVIKSASNNILGNHIIIDHGNGFSTTYAHCSELFVKKGIRVREGEIIASVGSSGSSTGYHLHFAMEADGLYFNPEHIFGFLADA